ncbi:unnamed protein product [Polarella glacialis]|uniref:Uncharacterized protein n=1 Tax=Polarella glacialis TaxID=89957 RepID=A0A813KR75_POLGL|nr:unnamed protein product [Polarella glacialis]
MVLHGLDAYAFSPVAWSLPQSISAAAAAGGGAVFESTRKRLEESTYLKPVCAVFVESIEFGGSRVAGHKLADSFLFRKNRTARPLAPYHRGDPLVAADGSVTFALGHQMICRRGYGASAWTRFDWRINHYGDAFRERCGKACWLRDDSISPFLA